MQEFETVSVMGQFKCCLGGDGIRLVVSEARQRLDDINDIREKKVYQVKRCMWCSVNNVKCGAVIVVSRVEQCKCCHIWSSVTGVKCRSV